mgnify:CR=1 FL=1
MTDSPSDTETTESALDAFAADFAAKVGAERWSTDFDTVHVYVTRDQWVEAATIARDEAKLGFFSWLSAVDWANLGVNLERLGETERSAEMYRKALAMDPTIGFAREGLERVGAD